jgi:phosphoribosylformimino-5-aminoimidazole carboxamide ribotide isomerase
MRRIGAAAPHVALFAGGGVRGPDDLARLADAGCDGALVATALHDGLLGAHEIARAGG